MAKVLLREYEEHIEGYGLTADLRDDAFFGVTPKEASQYLKVWTEFVEDPSLPPYKVGERRPGPYDIPYLEIPRGTLSVYGETRKCLEIAHDDDATCVMDNVNMFLEDLGFEFVDSDELNEKAYEEGSGKMFYDFQRIENEDVQD